MSSLMSGISKVCDSSLRNNSGEFFALDDGIATLLIMISIVIPTYNESENILELLSGLRRALEGAKIHDYELVVMDDDSPDGTFNMVNAMKDSSIRCVNRRGKKRGLANAVIDGFSEAKGDILGVMDSDLSHPPAVVPAMISSVMTGTNLVVGSRYVKGGGTADWPLKRRIISYLACRAAASLTKIKDATSGFFFFKKAILDNVSLNPSGFKIGLEIFVKADHRGNIAELPYVFTDRRMGKSKFGLKAIFSYLKQMIELYGYKRRQS